MSYQLVLFMVRVRGTLQHAAVNVVQAVSSRKADLDCIGILSDSFMRDVLTVPTVTVSS